MVTASIKLDKLSLSHRRNHLNLEAHCSLNLRVPDLVHPPMTPEKLLDSMLEGEIWVSRATGCCMDLTILLNGEAVEDENVCKSLDRSIQAASWWSQLSIMPIPKDLAMPQGKLSKPQTSFDLKYNTNEILIDGGSLSERDFARANATEVYLELMEITLYFEDIPEASHHSRKRPRMKPAISVGAFTQVSQEAGPVKTLNGSTLEYPIYTTLFDRVTQKIETKRDADTSDWSSLLAECQDNKTGTFSKRFTPSLVRNQMSTEGYVLSERSISLVDNTRLTIANLQPPALNISDAYRLIDVALRTLIGGKLVEGDKLVKVTSLPPRHTLSAIAPVLWNPGFSKKISCRASLLPRITSILSGSIIHSAQSPSLRRKIAQITAESVYSFKGASNLSSSGTTWPCDRGTTIQARLITMMRRSLYDEMAARRLKASSYTLNLSSNSSVQLSTASRLGDDEHNQEDSCWQTVDNFDSPPRNLLEDEEFQDILDYGNQDDDDQDDDEDLLSSLAQLKSKGIDSLMQLEESDEDNAYLLDHRQVSLDNMSPENMLL